MKTNHQPSIELFREVRAGFIKRGTTFSQWCRDAGENRSNARQAVLGAWDGPKGRAVRMRILKAAGVSA